MPNKNAKVWGVQDEDGVVVDLGRKMDWYEANDASAEFPWSKVVVVDDDECWDCGQPTSVRDRKGVAWCRPCQRQHYD